MAAYKLPNKERGVFTQSKTQRDTVAVKGIEPRLTGSAAADVVSTFGTGMQITGNIICPGALQIFGRVTGEIQAAQLVICDGAKVEGKIIAQETVIQGIFNGTIHGNNVKLQGNAAVDGEIFNKSLTIEPNVQFEGVSRRLDRTVEVPGGDHSAGLVPGPDVVG